MAVEGAAVRIGKQLAFSDISGVVFTRLRRSHAVTVVVSLGDFAAPGRWRVVRAPSLVQQDFQIVVELF
jgi:hypothetical protein